MSKLLELREQVRQILTGEFSGVQVDADGDFSIANESTRVFIRCIEQGDVGPAGRTIVNVYAPVVFNAPASPELFEYVALGADDFIFGHLLADRNDDGTVGVFIAHRLLGDYLDAQELIAAVAGVAISANNRDDEVKSRFGGELFNEG